MGDISDRLVDALATLEEVADALTAEEAAAELDEATLQVFWRDWPQLSSWAGSLWRQLNDDLALPATPASDPAVDEVGGEG
ncbi:MAG: hypothetical protein ACRDZ9_05875 [Acidimicrobiales bacterium]